VLSRIPEYNKDYSRDLAELLSHNWNASKTGQNLPAESGIVEIHVIIQWITAFSKRFQRTLKF
jgi:hypothetical protein